MKRKNSSRSIASVSLMLALVILALGIGNAQAASTQSLLDRLYEAAKAEGEVYLQSPVKATAIAEIAKIFEKRYPGIKVVYSNKSGGATVAQVVTEAGAGKVTIDLAACATYQPAPLLERDLIEVPNWGELGISDDHLVVAGRQVLYYEMAQGIAYNTKMLKVNEVPQTWEDLLDPRWAGGKLLIDSRGQFGRVFCNLDKERGLRIARGIKAQKPIFVPRMSPALQQLASEQAPLATVVLPELIELKERGAPVELTPISPVSVSISGLFIPKGAPHPNAAKLFAVWFDTAEARDQLDKLAGYGILEPCEASRQAKLLCEKGIKAVGGKTLEEAIAEDEYRKEIQKALGTLK